MYYVPNLHVRKGSRAHYRCRLSLYKGWFASLKEPEGVSWLRNWILNTSWSHLLFRPEFTAGSPLALKGISCQTTGAGSGFLDEELDFALRIHELDKWSCLLFRPVGILEEFRCCQGRTKILKMDFCVFLSHTVRDFFDRSRNQLMDITDSFLLTYCYCSLKGLSCDRPFAVHFVIVIS